MSAPICPVHKIPMVKKTAKTGKNAGHEFWGCPKWQECHQSKPIIESSSKSAPNKTTYNNKPRTGLPWGSAAPLCPAHHTTMVMRTSKQPDNLGHPFWGCRQYPQCRETVGILPPKCPTCGREMVVRVAQQGGFEGKSFWACPKPGCGGIIDIDGKIETKKKFTPSPPQRQPSVTGPSPRQSAPTRTTSATTSAKPVAKPPARNAETGQSIAPQKKTQPRPAEPDPFAELLTREFKAREYRPGYNALFFQNLAVPEPVLKELAYQPGRRKELSRYSGWRLDLPPAQPYDDMVLARVLNGILKILLRGKITLLSPYAEEELVRQFGQPDVKDLLGNVSCLYWREFSGRKSGRWLDGEGPSSPERVFYNDILPRILPHHRLYAIPQVHLACLVSPEEQKNASDQQRVDFLLTDGNRSLIVELDDSSHDGHQGRDRLRVEQTGKGGFETIRIPSHKVLHCPDEVVEQLRPHLAGFGKVGRSTGDGARLMLMTQLLHQLEIAIVLTLKRGILSPKNARFYVDWNSMGLEREEAHLLCQTMEIDISEQLQNYAGLYQEAPEIMIQVNLWPGSEIRDGVVFSSDDALVAPLPIVFFHNTFLPYNIIVVLPADRLHLDMHPDRDIVRYFLNLIFRKEDFVEGQYEAIERTLYGEDTVVLLPTGGGKSIAFQLAAFLQPGVSMVISPIVALVNDQVDNLTRAGVDRVLGITSQISNPETKARLIRAFGNNEYLLVYVTPERLQTEPFREVLRTLAMYTSIPVVAIDEAHCVSEWGHDFRTSYLNVGRIGREFCSIDGRPPCLPALTGTASSAVLKDVQRELQMPLIDSVITPQSFERKELHYSVIFCRSEEKAATLKTILEQKIPELLGLTKEETYNTRGDSASCGIVFCPHVNADHGVIKVSEGIRQMTGIEVEVYSGKTPKDHNQTSWEKRKKEVAEGFKNNQINLLCSTNAFGMGIDKPNIRYIIHWGLPPSIESFYQEVGRAGRDRQDAYSFIIASTENESEYNSLFDFNADHSKLQLDKKNKQDDINRMLWFHANSFKGVKQELEMVMKTMDELGIKDVAIPKHCTFSVARAERGSYEKALHRLVILGAVSDYTLDYASDEFGVRVSGVDYDGIIENYRAYVGGYNVNRVPRELEKAEALRKSPYKWFILNMSMILVDFIYDTVEKGRRRALREMYLLAKETLGQKNADRLIRNRILRYLESTFAPVIEGILSSPDLGFSSIRDLIDGYETEAGELVNGLRSDKDAAAIRGQVSRFLESTPDHPGLLFLRSLSEAFCRKFDLDTVVSNYISALDSLRERYSHDQKDLRGFLLWLLSRMATRSNDACEACIKGTLERSNDIGLSSQMLRAKELKPALLYYPMVHFYSHLIARTKEKYFDNENQLEE